MKTRSESVRKTAFHVRSPGLAAFAIAVGLTAGSPALADLEFEPILRGAWDYDDNAGLADSTDEEEQI